jgi:hypothetical protein
LHQPAELDLERRNGARHDGEAQAGGDKALQRLGAAELHHHL